MAWKIMTPSTDLQNLQIVIRLSIRMKCWTTKSAPKVKCTTTSLKGSAANLLVPDTADFQRSNGIQLVSGLGGFGPEQMRRRAAHY